VEDIKKPETKKDNNYTETPQEIKPTHTFIDETNKYGPDYHPNVRIDMEPTARLDATPPVTKKPGFDSSTLAVLQWLTYALWGSTVIALSVLTVSVLDYYITGSNIGDSILYSVAAVLVLLPISLICDLLYLKNEPETKSRIASVIMIVHAVLFALFTIGSLITIAFSIVSLMVSSSGHDTIMVTLYSSLTIAFLFLVLFLRTVLPKKYSRIRYFYIAIMLIAVAVVCAYGFFGPIADAQVTRNDKLIETNLPTVGEAVSTYASDNNKLPATLNDLKLTGDAKKIVTDKLVTYKKDSAPSSSYYTSSKDFYYQLCVTYKKDSTDPYATPNTVSSSNSSSSSSLISSGNDYSYYVTTIPHPAGEKCYKLMTYNNDITPMTNSNI
jgi:uncharacterized membrane protein